MNTKVMALCTENARIKTKPGPGRRSCAKETEAIVREIGDRARRAPQKPRGSSRKADSTEETGGGLETSNREIFRHSLRSCARDAGGCGLRRQRQPCHVRASCREPGGLSRVPGLSSGHAVSRPPRATARTPPASQGPAEPRGERA